MAKIKDDISNVFSEAFIIENIAYESRAAEVLVVKIFKIILPVFIALTFSYFVVDFFWLNGGKNFQPDYLYLILFCIIVLFYHRFIVKQVKQGKYLTLIKFINVTVEISAATIVIYFLSRIFPAEVILSGPLMMLYIIMVAMTGFRYSFSISLYAGVLAAVQQLIVHIVLYPYIAPDLLPVVIDFGTGGMIQKSVLIFLSGLASAFIALNTKNMTKKVAKLSNEKYQIKNTFGQYVSKEVRDLILSGEMDLNGTETKGVVLFSDLRNFTTMMEKNDSRQIINQLNDYFTGMVEVIAANNGIVNKFIGDAILAIFGAFGDKENAEFNAVKAAVEMQKKLSYLNARWKDCGNPPFEMGIGVDMGAIITGNVGSFYRKEFTCMGNVVNSAMHLEDLTKKYNSKIVVSNRIVQYSKVNTLFSFEYLGGEVCEKKSENNILNVYEVKY